MIEVESGRKRRRGQRRRPGPRPREDPVSSLSDVFDRYNQIVARGRGGAPTIGEGPRGPAGGGSRPARHPRRAVAATPGRRAARGRPSGAPASRPRSTLRQRRCAPLLRRASGRRATGPRRGTRASAPRSGRRPRGALTGRRRRRARGSGAPTPPAPRRAPAAARAGRTSRAATGRLRVRQAASDAPVEEAQLRGPPSEVGDSSASSCPRRPSAPAPPRSDRGPRDRRVGPRLRDAVRLPHPNAKTEGRRGRGAAGRAHPRAPAPSSVRPRPSCRGSAPAAVASLAGEGAPRPLAERQLLHLGGDDLAASQQLVVHEAPRLVRNAARGAQLAGDGRESDLRRLQPRRGRLAPGAAAALRRALALAGLGDDGGLAGAAAPCLRTCHSLRPQI